MTDKKFLEWLHERLKHVHKENELFDYMHRLRAIIANTDETVKSNIYNGEPRDYNITH